MIKNILLPEKISGYYIFPERIIGFEIEKTQVNAIQVYISEKQKITIEKFLQQPLDVLDSENLTHEEKITNSIKTILSKTDKYNSIHLTLPGYLVIFKELILPFIDLDKIRMVLDFEIESILPFDIQEAVTDFIVTGQDVKNKKTTILVAIARKKDIIELLAPFKNAGLEVKCVIVDIVGLYNIYQSLPQYKNIKEDVVIIDIEQSYTIMAYIQDNQLKIIRAFQQGTLNLAKKIASMTNIEKNKALEYLIRFGLESNDNKEYNDAVSKSLIELTDNMQFTLDSFKTQLPLFTEKKKIILTGQGSEINGLSEYLTNRLKIECEILNVNSLMQNKNIIIKEKKLPNSFVLSLAAAAGNDLNTTNQDFNLLRKNLEIIDYSLLKKQVITSLILIFIIFVLLIGYNNIQTNKIKKEINISRSQVVTALKNTFDITDPATLKDLPALIQTANSKVSEEESIWFSFSLQARFSFLKYLQDLVQE